MSVLVVDDEIPIRDSIRDALEDEGVPTLVAADGVEALEQLKKHDVYAVIVDLLMPGMGGAELLAQMEAQPELSQIPVIIITSDPARAPAGRIVFRKPVRLESILETVKKTVATRHEEGSDA